MASKIKVNAIEVSSGSEIKIGTALTVSAGIVSATSFEGDGANLKNLPASELTGTLPAISAEKLTSIPAANITGTIPGTSLGGVDLAGIRKDISTLALQVAVDTNRAAYNLTDSLIDQFETDIGIASSTTVMRNTDGEYFSSKSEAWGNDTEWKEGDLDTARFENVKMQIRC